MNLSQDIGRTLQRGTTISDWEYRTGRALWRLEGQIADRIEACLMRWITKGHAELGKNIPLTTVVGYAASRLPKTPTKDPAEARLRAMHAFAEGLQQNGHRIHHTYLDLMLEAKRGGIYYACEIEAEAFRLAGDILKRLTPWIATTGLCSLTSRRPGSRRNLARFSAKKSLVKRCTRRSSRMPKTSQSI